MENTVLKNKKIIVGITSAILVVSLGVSKGVGSKLDGKLEEESILTENSTELGKELKLWKDNEVRLEHIKNNYPLKDGEQSILNFLDHLVYSAKSNLIDILELKVNLKTLFSDKDLVNTELQVKLRGDTDKIREFTKMSREVEFVNISSIKTVYNSELDVNDTIITYVVTGRYSKPNFKLKNPKDIINLNTIFKNITGEWIDYELYKKQIKELESTGRIISEGNNITGTSDNSDGGGSTGEVSSGDNVEMELDGFEEVSDEVLSTPPQNQGSVSSGGNATPKPTPKPTKPKEDIIKAEPFKNPLDTMELIEGFSDLHQGISLKVKTGTSVKSVASGKVIQVGEFGEFGKTVMVEHKNGEISMYANLSEISVKEGDKIKQSHVVGKSGKLGEVEQLYFSFAKGDFINPLEIFKVDKK